MLDDPEYRIPLDFEAWTNDQREDWIFNADGITRHEQRWRKDVVMQFNAEHAPAIIEPEEHPYRYSYEEEHPAYDESGAPPRCPLEDNRGHVWATCPRCLARQRWARETADAWFEERAASALADRMLDGSAVLDLPAFEPLWGFPDAPIAAAGQPWGIFAMDGTGKTTAASQLVKVRVRLTGWGETMWGEPVAALEGGKRVLYLAMDRSRQILESFQRGVDDRHRAELAERVRIWPGPVPYNLSFGPGRDWIVRKAEQVRAGMIVFDTRKDIGSTIEAKEVIGFNQTVQTLTELGIEVLILGHLNKGKRSNGWRPSLDDVSGHREVFSGLGSVLALHGTAGSTTIEALHLKPIRGIHRPTPIVHDHIAGRSDVGAALGQRQFAITGAGGATMTGIVPVRAVQPQVLSFIDAQGGEAKADALGVFLNDSNLARTLKPLRDAGIIEHNGGRGPQSGYRRGPNARGASV